MPPVVIKPPNSGLCMLDHKNNRKYQPKQWQVALLITLEGFEQTWQRPPSSGGRDALWWRRGWFILEP